jgi:hypothetical protein
MNSVGKLINTMNSVGKLINTMNSVGKLISKINSIGKLINTMNSVGGNINLVKNYCRDPQGLKGQPWCFTTDLNIEWEYCEIQQCIGKINL